MNAIVGVIVDNCVFITTIFVLLLVSVFAVILWRRKLQTNGGDTVVGEEFFVEDSQPRSKKSVKLKPKKTKPEKALYFLLYITRMVSMSMVLDLMCQCG